MEQKKAKNVKTTKAKEVKAKPAKVKEVKVNKTKATKTKATKTKKGKNGTTIAAIVIVFVLLLAGITYCALLMQEQYKANKTVDTMFEAIKSGDNETRNKYLAYDKIVSNNETKDQNTAEEVNTQFNALFSKLEYKVVKTQVDFKKASVTVEVSNKNTGKVFANYISKAMSLAISKAFSEGYTEEKLNADLQQVLTDEMNSDTIETVTNTITIDMVKENNNWKIITDSDKLANVVLPGLVDKLQAVQSAFNN